MVRVNSSWISFDRALEQPSNLKVIIMCMSNTNQNESLSLSLFRYVLPLLSSLFPLPCSISLLASVEAQQGSLGSNNRITCHIVCMGVRFRCCNKNCPVQHPLCILIYTISHTHTHTNTNTHRHIHTLSHEFQLCPKLNYNKVYCASNRGSFSLGEDLATLSILSTDSLLSCSMPSGGMQSTQR